jgi:hypothetical protein
MADFNHLFINARPFLATHVFFVLAFLPGVIAVLAHLLTVPRRKQALQKQHEHYLAAEELIAREWEKPKQEDLTPKGMTDATQRVSGTVPSQRQGGSRFRRLIELFVGPPVPSAAQQSKGTALLDSLSPQLPGLLVGAAIVTLIFSVAAALSDGPIGIGIGPSATSSLLPISTLTPTLTPASSPTPTPRPSASMTPTPTPTLKSAASALSPIDPPPNATPTPTPTPTPTLTATGGRSGGAAPVSAGTPTATATAAGATTSSQQGNLGEGRRALVIAAYGAYVTTVYLLISRLNSSGVSGTFLVNSALRTTIAMILAFAAGEFGVLTSMSTGNQAAALYFLLGMFPVWAIDFLRQKSMAIFQATEAGCENLPLCLVDGLDDGIIDRLAESGMWDIQHLAMADPRAVSARSLYPLDRVVDWIDQAILIAFVKSNITHYRSVGIRSATNLASIYGEAEGQVFSLLNVVEQKKNADELLDNIATKTNVPRSAIEVIGKRLFYDQKVNVIWLLWRRWPAGPIDARQLIDEVLRAARGGAEQTGVVFNPLPELGKPVNPSLGSAPALRDAFVKAMDLNLARLGYRWAGTASDVTELGSWNEVVDRVLNRTIV